RCVSSRAISRFTTAARIIESNFVPSIHSTGTLSFFLWLMMGQSRPTSRFRNPTGLPLTSTTTRTSDGTESFLAFGCDITIHCLNDVTCADSVFLQQRLRRTGAWNLANSQPDDLRLIPNHFQDGIAESALLVMILDDDDTPARFLRSGKNSLRIDRLHGIRVN